ncbi:nucleoside deaminase [Gilvimarinus polysaccharolyticus]|uniref:nucleoside deaminase n=1 Tax=Gilvimarinus polysaccharolyticus TaxID=863921 RepID=UPI00067332AC|nr:nucleoside deaminase [Gilvimarinus polysaccharolyticus]
MKHPTSIDDSALLARCLELACESASSGGGPFSALVVKEGEIIAEACNSVTRDRDPTAHAEVAVIRKACQILDDHQLTGCTIYASCEPCPMCLGAIYWARADKVIFAASREQASKAGFDDSLVYREVNIPGPERQIPFYHLALSNAEAPFQQWQEFSERHCY